MFSKAASAIVACVLALAGCSERTGTARHGAGSCGQTSTPQALSEPGSFVKTNTPLYSVDDQGRLLVGGFNGRPFRVLHRRPFQSPNLYVSPDRRWVLFGGWIRGSSREELWLFDTRTEKVTKVFEGPDLGLGIPAFSPDGRSIAIYKNYDSRWPSPAGTGLYVIDAARGQTDFVGPIQGSAIPALEVNVHAEWAAEGDTILLLAGGDDIREFHAFSPASGKFRRIDGRIDFEARETEFSENGVKIPALEQTRARSIVMYTERPSPDGSMMARVNEKYELVVTGAGRQSVTIDTGSYNDCEGVTILVVDWVDGNKYLVYYMSGAYYIAEPATGRKAELLEPSGPIKGLTW